MIRKLFLLLLPIVAAPYPAIAQGDKTPSSLMVSKTGHFLATSDGKPFFWLADTPWLLFHYLSPTEVERYLNDRAAKGFTVIQAMMLGTDDEFKVSDSVGGMAFKEGDPSHPNEAYFLHVDTLSQRRKKGRLENCKVVFLI